MEREKGDGEKGDEYIFQVRFSGAKKGMSTFFGTFFRGHEGTLAELVLAGIGRTDDRGPGRRRLHLRPRRPAKVIDETIASDHRPLLVVLRWQGE